MTTKAETATREKPRVMTPDEAAAYQQTAEAPPWTDYEDLDWDEVDKYKADDKSKVWPDKQPGEEEIIPGSPSDTWQIEEVIYLANDLCGEVLLPDEAVTILEQSLWWKRFSDAPFNTDFIVEQIEEYLYETPTYY